MNFSYLSYAKEIDLMKLSASLFVLLMLTLHNCSYSANLSKQEICKAVAKHKENAVLLTERPTSFANSFSLGEFDFSDKSEAPDFIESTQKFRIIVRPKSFVLDEDCSMSVCTDRVEVPPQCPNSREYLVNLRVNPRKFAAGRFDSMIYLRIFDEKHGSAVGDSFNLSFKNTISGVIQMPHAEIIQNKDVSNALSDLLKGKQRSVFLELINNGNRPLILGKWDKDERIGGSLTLNASECEDKKLDPGTLCKLELANPSGKPATGNYLFWENHFYKEPLNITLYLSRQLTEDVEYNIKNN